MIAVSSLQSAEQVRSKLLERCLLEIEHLKHETVLQDGELKTAITQAMLQADPQALIELQLNCPNCGHTWTALFDIANFLWRELDAWARRTLRDVHKLASAYGWSETQILALSPTRRRLYLELVSP